MKSLQLVKSLVLSMVMSPGLLAQTPPPASQPSPPPQAKAPIPPTPAPQVVTIVHRLNGLKMFRLLLRSEKQLEAVANLDETVNLLQDVHTNVIAGLAMDDGQTIVAWLPEAELEFSWTTPSDLFSPQMDAARTAAGKKESSFDVTPDLTVIDSDGKSLAAEYIGLDAASGLSILRLAQKSEREPEETLKPIDVGERVRMLGPEPAPERTLSNRNMYVRMGTTVGTVRTILKAPSGGVAKFKVSSPRLSAQNVGGVVVDESGRTIGIIDGIAGDEASIVPTVSIQRAVNRVLEKRASVPRPWLGVKGEAVADLRIDQLRNHGWQTDRAALLAGDHQGILLTSVLPGSPAAVAALQAGDVILKVNEDVVKDAEEFSWILEQSEPSRPLTFTVARPNKPMALAFSIKLSQQFPFPPFPPPAIFGSDPLGPALIRHGIETVALKPPATSRLGVRSGLLVVYVQPFSAASDAGLKAGDVIQSINGKPVNRSFVSPANLNSISTFEIVRKKEKIILRVAKVK